MIFKLNFFVRNGLQLNSGLYKFAFPFVLFNIFLASHAYTQSNEPRQLNQQLNFHFDNNFFLFNGDDGYYTNGTFVKYNHLGRKAGRASKRIISFELGQKIFIAHSRKILPVPNIQQNIPGGIEQIDRPIAGYLFGKFAQTSFYENRTLLEVGVSVGSVGANSMGQNVLELWHEAIGVKDYWNWVWKYQVKNEVGINLHGTFAYSLLSEKKRSLFQLTPITQVTVGTIFTDASQSVLFQFGKLRPMASSGFWSSRLQAGESHETNQGSEFFIFYKPEVRYQAYNATIQGGLLSTDKGPILSEVNPIVFCHEWGLQFSRQRFSVSYSMLFQSKEAKSQFSNQSHASIACSFSF